MKRWGLAIVADGSTIFKERAVKTANGISMFSELHNTYFKQMKLYIRARIDELDCITPEYIMLMARGSFRIRIIVFGSYLSSVDVYDMLTYK